MASATEPGTDRRVDDLSPELVEYYRGEGWTVEEDAPVAAFPVVYEDGKRVDLPVPLQPGEFNPSEHTVDEVLTHFETADPAEVAHVIATEKSGKGRKGIVEYEPVVDPEPEFGADGQPVVDGLAADGV